MSDTHDHSPHFRNFNEILDYFFGTRPSPLGRLNYDLEISKAELLMDVVCMTGEANSQGLAPAVNRGPLTARQAVDLVISLDAGKYPRHRCPGPHYLWEPTSGKTYQVTSHEPGVGTQLHEMVWVDDSPDDEPRPPLP